ncbi:hypothetical protein L1987_11451 [Smallanthus sonchifolius]|uniref:Uncharacterized protein n=1 Tax=Smallanthus sonchifolius TaxID=185202 RepID=A0ACB9JDM8_9ASTR|nr:hypothetical protein L1987_11451 [Smallanthus sonchifolius]
MSNKAELGVVEVFKGVIPEAGMPQPVVCSKVTEPKAGAKIEFTGVIEFFFEATTIVVPASSMVILEVE